MRLKVPAVAKLAMGSKPKRHSPINEFRVPPRKYMCMRYDACLDYCIAKQWPGFSCTACTIEETITEVIEKSTVSSIYSIMERRGN